MTHSAYTASRLNISEKQTAPERHAIPEKIWDQLHAVRQCLNTDGSPDSLRTAVWVVAPVLAGFGGWLATHISDRKALPLGVMREGRFLCRLMRTFGIEARELALNRHFGFLAAYGCGDDEAMLNWLVRTRTEPLSHTALKRAFPRYNPPTLSAQINLATAQDLVTTWRAMGETSPVFSEAQSAARDVFAHWRKTLGKDQARAVALMDFACAGNIQRSLQTVLHHNADETQLIGLNFLTTPGVRWAKEKGCEIHGFLAEDGKPEWISTAYARTPELAEIFVAAVSLGPLAGYAAEGEARWHPPLLEATHQQIVDEWQDHILDAAQQYWHAMGGHLSPDLCRTLWGRLLMHPLPEEAAAFSSWPLDAGLDLYARRTMAVALDSKPEPWTKMDTAWPAASKLLGTENNALAR